MRLMGIVRLCRAVMSLIDSTPRTTSSQISPSSKRDGAARQLHHEAHDNQSTHGDCMNRLDDQTGSTQDDVCASSVAVIHDDVLHSNQLSSAHTAISVCGSLVDDLGDQGRYPLEEHDDVLVSALAQKDRRTKRLALRLTNQHIAVVHHMDMDYTSAESLVETGVRAVVNAASSMSGYYPNQGPQLLLEHGIPILDRVGDEAFEAIRDDVTLSITKSGELIMDGRIIGRGTLLTLDMLAQQCEVARRDLDKRLDSFVRNTLSYLEDERSLLSADTWVPATSVSCENRHVLVVVRGASYQDDLMSLSGYIREMNPVLIAVDGGADALIEAGWTPDIIVGDMDSISDAALLCGAQLIAHAYVDRPSPSLERIEQLQLSATPWRIRATSEDLALLLAYHSGADLIVAVGTHASLIDYLDKGRGGMASTFLVRLKVGNKLVDAKGVSKLYRSSPAFKHIAVMCIAAAVVIAIIFFITPALRHALGLAFQLLVSKYVG